MNKGELVAAVAGDAKISKSQAQDAVDAVLKRIEKTLKKGGKVTLVGFGTFSVSKRGARQGRNPRTGMAIRIPARKVARFSPGKALKDAIN